MISRLTNLYFYRHHMTDILRIHVISSLNVLCRESLLYFHASALAVMETLTSTR